MFAFPKLLYLFQAIPLYLRPRDEKPNRTLRMFIWQGKRPRVALHILHQHKLHGGINFPDIRLYNLSTNLPVLQDWFMGTSIYSPTLLEGQLYPMISLPNLLHLPHSALSAEVKNNPLFMDSWRTWVQWRRKLNLSYTVSLSPSFVRNPQFQNGRAHSIFQHWALKGLTRIGDLFDLTKQTTLTFNQACIKFNFLLNHPFHFLQAQSCAIKTSKSLSTPDWDNTLLAKFTSAGALKGQICSFYGFLCSPYLYMSRVSRVLPGGQLKTLNLPSLIF